MLQKDRPLNCDVDKVQVNRHEVHDTYTSEIIFFIYITYGLNRTNYNYSKILTNLKLMEQVITNDISATMKVERLTGSRQSLMTNQD